MGERTSVRAVEAGSGTASEPALVCSNLSYAYGARTAVVDLSFSVAPGEAYGLLGPNGAGKTTTISMVCGILEARTGSVVVDGHRMDGGAGGRRARASLGYVPQGVALFPTLSLRENLSFWATMQGVPRRLRRERVAWALDVAGLTDRARERVERCSGGMQRRLNLAAGLINRPRLLVLDEPTVGVDTQSRAALLTTLRELRDDGTAIVYTSHYLDEVTKLCDRIGIVDHGRMVAEGRPADLLRDRPDLPDLEGLFLDLTGTGTRD